MIKKSVILGLVAAAAAFAAALNIWIIPHIETIILGNRCVEGNLFNELIVLPICLGIIVVGGIGAWRMRTWPVVLNKRWILLFLANATLMSSGMIWLFETLADLYLCLTFLGWGAR